MTVHLEGKYIHKSILSISNYPKDPQIVPYPLATLKCSHALLNWTCADFLKLNNSLGHIVFQSKKVRISPTRLGMRAF